MEEAKRFVVAGILFQNDKILFVKRNRNERNFPGLFELPSGKVEPGETNEQAIKREFKEETELDITILKSLDESFFTSIDRNGSPQLTKKTNYMVAQTGTGKIVLSPEHTEYAWIETKDFDTYEIIPDLKKEIITSLQLREC
jgi:8-oxo-dGTP diphosphatase